MQGFQAYQSCLTKQEEKEETRWRCCQELNLTKWVS